MRVNYHTHCEFCDGRASAAEMAAAAAEKGYQVLGFSSHSPLPFPSEGNMERSRLGEYVVEIRRLGREWEGKGLEILLGLEIEWVKGISSPRDELFLALGLDYSIGSLHFVDLPGPGRFAVDLGQDDFESHCRQIRGKRRRQRGLSAVLFEPRRAYRRRRLRYPGTFRSRQEEQRRRRRRRGTLVRRILAGLHRRGSRRREAAGGQGHHRRDQRRGHEPWQSQDALSVVAHTQRTTSGRDQDNLFGGRPCARAPRREPGRRA